ncbi:6479_t:CDS:2, partial [Gigaspora rosea]
GHTKDFIKQEFCENNTHIALIPGDLPPLYSTLAQWVGESWNDINPFIIRKAFKCCENIKELNVNDVSSEEYEEAEGNNND